MTDLSPAAQAVLDAFKDQVELTWLTKDPEQVGLAAALRAAADHCAEGATHWDLYAIAAELEGADD